MIDNVTIQRIKDAANVVDVVSDFYDLKPDGTGGTFTCLCPFHDDRHVGSFKVSRTKNYYTCFACGAHGGPVDFLMYHENMKFMDAIRWLAAKYGIACEGVKTEDFKTQPTVCKPHTPPAPLPMLELPADMVNKTAVGKAEHDTLREWLHSLPWNETERARIDKVLNMYLVGHGKDGHSIFWQVDEAGKVRTGKMMLYKRDGHRDKETKGNFDYVHSRLLRCGYWDDTKTEVQHCFFGQHLTTFFPDAVVYVVESEKTALICSIAYGDGAKHVWVASGGKSGLLRGKFEPFINGHRVVVLIPDKDGQDNWHEICNQIGYDKMLVNTQIMSRNWKPQDGDKADIADIIIRRLYERRDGVPSDDVKARKVAELRERYPLFGELVDKLKLKPI